MGRSALQARRRADNLQEILDAARELVLSDGPGALTLGAVAAKVGVSTPALYHYFDNKKALLQALILEAVSVEADVLVATAEGWRGPEPDVVGGVVRAMYDHYRPNLSRFRLIYLLIQSAPDQMGLDADLLPRLHPHSKRMFDALEAVLVRGKKAGTVSKKISPRTAVVSAHMAAVGMLTMIALAERAADPLRQGDEHLIASLSELLRSGVRAR
ncbi:MAG: TetR/AcrR family transcriptional regulator [Deltaproteobacteria bacterium]|nr:TetR/AcrR family transcriptional regulator [Deltaproteobacteria bacterium]